MLEMARLRSAVALTLYGRWVGVASAGLQALKDPHQRMLTVAFKCGNEEGSVCLRWA